MYGGSSVIPKVRCFQGVGVLEWEAEIDDRVAPLHGFTGEEMKIIRHLQKL
jgi:hypothetical protein